MQMEQLVTRLAGLAPAGPNRVDGIDGAWVFTISDHGTSSVEQGAGPAPRCYGTASASGGGSSGWPIQCTTPRGWSGLSGPKRW